MESGFSAKKCVTAALIIGNAVAVCTAAVVPSLGVIFIPVAAVLSYCLSYLLGWWFLPAAAAVHFVLSVSLHRFDLFSVIGSVLLLALLAPRLLCGKLSLLAEIGVCAVVGIVAVCASFGFAALGSDKSAEELIPSYYASANSDPVICSVALRHYRSLDAEALGHEPLSSDSQNYGEEVLREYSDYVGRELDGNLLWYLSGFGAFAGGVAAFAGYALINAYGDRRKGKIADLRLGRSYLIVIAAVLLFSALSIFGYFGQATRTVFNIFVTIPTTLVGISVLYHSLSRPPGKIKIATLVLFWLLLATAALFYEWGLIIFGFLGLADIVLDIRKLLDWALS